METRWRRRAEPLTLQVCADLQIRSASIAVVDRSRKCGCWPWRNARPPRSAALLVDSQSGLRRNALSRTKLLSLCISARESAQKERVRVAAHRQPHCAERSAARTGTRRGGRRSSAAAECPQSCAGWRPRVCAPRAARAASRTATSSFTRVTCAGESPGPMSSPWQSTASSSRRSSSSS